MKKFWIILGVLIVVIGLYAYTAYNGLVNSNEAVTSQWAQVQSQYQRRFDLIPNLVASVKGAQIQEQKVFSDIADARTHYSGATTQADQVNAANQVESAVSRLLVIVENYPQLKSNDTIQALIVELEGTENRISVERMRYNNDVQAYNLKTKRFPSSIFAHMYGFSEKPYFQADVQSQQAPQVKFQ